MEYKALHCWDCGTQVIWESMGKHYPMPILREVKYGWSSGAYSESPFCAPCASREWTPARIAAFKSALDVINPMVRPLQITKIEGVSPVLELEVTVLEP